MNGCPREETLSALLDGELAPPERQAVEAHAAHCADCAAALESLRAVDALAGRLAPDPVTDAEWDAAWTAIQARITARPARRAWRVLVPLAAAAVLFLGVGLWAYLPGPGGQPHAIAVGPDCLVDNLETAEGYTSMYQEADDLTIITLLPESPEEVPSADDTL